MAAYFHGIYNSYFLKHLFNKRVCKEVVRRFLSSQGLHIPMLMRRAEYSPNFCRLGGDFVIELRRLSFTTGYLEEPYVIWLLVIYANSDTATQ